MFTEVEPMISRLLSTLSSICFVNKIRFKGLIKKFCLPAEFYVQNVNIFVY